MHLRRSHWLVAGLLGFTTSLSCMRATTTAEGVPLISTPTTRAAPKLVVFIVVDQLRGDMLDRYRDDMKYGYARLMQGAWFTNAFQDHGITETAPGHASTMSGRFPRSTGIVSNLEGVVDSSYQLVTGLPTEDGASPKRFEGTTLFDWMYAKDNKSRALSVSMKDRSAILMIGRAKQNVYWSSFNGSFTTSTYYSDTLPKWVRDFNARRIAQRYAGGEWRLSRQDTKYEVADSVSLENRGRDFTFPHQLPADTLEAAYLLRNTPTLDSMTALLALEGLRSTGIGQGPHTDLLAVSFSSTDRVGHEYGPDSREAYENQMRLDETLGWFLDSLYAQRDPSSVLIALTADHGVQPIQELARQRGLATGSQGLRVSLHQEVASLRSRLVAAGVDPNAFYYDGETIALNRPMFMRARVNADSVLDDFARDVRKVPGVARVDRIRALRRADFATNPIARRWAHQIPLDSPIELVITLTRYSGWTTAPAMHGSPYDQDAFVPIIFYGSWANPGRYSVFARVVDMAPTLAAMIGVRPSEKLDGVVLLEAVKR